MRKKEGGGGVGRSLWGNADSPFLQWGGVRKGQVKYIILHSDICLKLKDIVNQLPNLFILGVIIQ